MIGALRSQPARTPSILFGGEIRNVRAAEVAIQAAVNGFLVIATGFATDIPSGLDALLKMLGHARARALGALLRIVLYQRLIGDVLQALIKVLPRPNSRVATAIAGGELLRLSDEVQMQANLVRAGSDLCKATGATA